MGLNKIIFSLTLVAFCSAVFAQDMSRQVLDSFSGKFITAIRTNEKQQACLVTDRSVFIAGESIWFRAFLLNPVSRKLIIKSNFIFVDLVNEKDIVIKVLILDAANKQLDSRIIIPDSTATGYYWVRAYTRQMAEGDISNIAVKSIYIVGKTNDYYPGKSLKNAVKPDQEPKIAFYPEGGSIITGVSSTVAFDARDANGGPLIVDGFLKDQHDAIVARLTTGNSGLGKFDFEPSGYRRYKAVINWHGKEIGYPLPPFNFYTGQVSVTKQSTAYKLRILLGDSIYSKDAVTYLIGVSKDSLIFASVGKGLYEVVVNEQELPGDIATFYLFDKNFNFLSRRSVYVHDNNVHVKIAADKNVYATRGKVMLNLSIMDAQQQPIPSLVAVSVIDTLFSDPREQCTFPGIVDNQQPGDLFSTRYACLTADEKDVMMIIKDSIYPTPGKIIPQQAAGVTDSLLYIRGLALTAKNEPSANKVLTLISNSGVSVFYTDTTDNAGRFCFPVENYADSTQFAIEVRNLKGQKENIKIILDTLMYPRVSTPAYLKQFLPVQTKAVKKYVNTYYHTTLTEDRQTLPPVTVKDRKKPVNYTESKRVSRNSAILSADNLDERTSVGNSILQVGGMHMLNGVLVVNGLTGMQAPDASSEPIIFVDGAQVASSAGVGESSPDMNYLNSLNSKDIDFIEILKGPEAANYGVRGGHGVILVNMLSTRRELKTDGNNLKIFYAKGLSSPALFPVTDYRQKDVKTETSKDNRSTLFWDGSLLSDAVHNAALSFYTSDIPATYKVSVTGITIHGELIYKTITFQSK